MTLAIFGILTGFVILYLGAEWLVKGASDIADRLALSRSFVGLTLVAMGTRFPTVTQARSSPSRTWGRSRSTRFIH